MNGNEKDCSNDIKVMTDAEFQQMHNVLKEVFNDAVSDYRCIKKISSYDTELRQARISVATAAQTLLEAEHEAHDRIEARRDMRKKVLAHS